MRLLILGDVVGRAGRAVVTRLLPELRRDWRLDGVVVNGENAAGGFGITEAIAEDLFAAGADAVTLGNHAFDQREALSFIETEPRLLRVCNYPPITHAPGRGAHLFNVAGRQVLVVSVMGRAFMDPLDCPYTAVDREVSACPLGAAADAIIVDVHAEASGEKQGIGHFLDGRVSMVVGTHTHVPTADARILSGGTAFQTDLGMCGDYDSVIGMNKEIAVRRQSVKLPGQRNEPADGPGMACGVFVETDDRTGLARRIEPIRVGFGLRQIMPTADEREDVS
jgi:2',3'-cyclic-nucleotide 2'-phosphodiesterase